MGDPPFQELYNDLHDEVLLLSSLARETIIRVEFER